MEELRKINKLDELPDAQIVEHKVYQGERGAYLFAFGPLARLLATPEELDGCVFLVIVRWLPMAYIDDVETILDAEGYSVSRA